MPLIVRTIIYNLALLEASNKAIGGICFSLFRDINSIGIDLIAIKNDFQGKGIGSKLINKLKKKCLKENFDYLIVFADRNAEDFYKKLGFVKRIHFSSRTFEKHLGYYLNVLEMEYALNKSAIKVGGSLFKKADDDNNKKSNLNLLNFEKIKIINALENAIDKENKAIFSIEAPIILISKAERIIGEVIDISTIISEIFTEKYQNISSVLVDIEKAFINLKQYYKDDLVACKNILRAENIFKAKLSF